MKPDTLRTAGDWIFRVSLALAAAYWLARSISAIFSAPHTAAL